MLGGVVQTYTPAQARAYVDPLGREDVGGLGSLTKYVQGHLHAWIAPLDGDTGLSPSGGKATQIADSFGGSLVLTQGTSSKRATIDSSTKLANRPTLLLSHSGATLYTGSAGITGNSDHTQLVVWKSANNSSSYCAISAFGPDGGSISSLGKIDSRLWYGGSGDTNPTSSGITDDLGWHILSKRHASGQTYFFMDGRPISGTAITNPYTQTFNVSSAVLGIGQEWTANAVFACPDGNLAADAFYASLSAADLQKIERYFAIALGLTKNRQIVCKGDSLTKSSIDSSHEVASPWPQQLPTLLGITADLTNLGLYGETTDTMLADQPTEVLPLFSSIRGVTSPLSSPKNLYVHMSGANELKSSVSPSTIHSRIATCCGNAKAAGWNVIVCSTPAIGGAAQIETDRQTLRSLIAANWTTYAHAYADNGGITHLATQADTANGTYYQADTTHLTQAGYDLIGINVAASAAPLA